MSDSKQFTYYPVVEGERPPGRPACPPLLGLPLTLLPLSSQIRKKWRGSARKSYLSFPSTLVGAHTWGVLAVGPGALALEEVSGDTPFLAWAAVAQPWGLPAPLRPHPSFPLLHRWEPQLPLLPGAGLQQHLLAWPPPHRGLPGGCADEGP